MALRIVRIEPYDTACGRLNARTLIRSLRERVRATRRGWAASTLRRHLPTLDLATRHWQVGGQRLGCRETLERLLLGNLLPFWHPHVVDAQHGGFRLNHDFEGRWRGPAPKHIVTQARTTWFFATLARTVYGSLAHLDAAAHGWHFLRRRQWDSKHGGFFWEVDAAGETALQDRKHLYGQAFGLFALSAFAEATSDPEALGRAADLFALIERHAHDAEHGGYHEDLERDWRGRVSRERNALGSLPGQKTLNTHLHVLEAFTAYHRVTGDDIARARLLELIRLLRTALLSRRVRACGDLFARDWTPVSEPRNRHISYGHDLELLWLLRDTCKQLGQPVDMVSDIAEIVFESCWRHGYDPLRGGFFHRGRLGLAADQREKIWWVQAEALISSLDEYLATGLTSAGQCFAGTLDWIVGYQADWTNGEWHAQIDESHRPAGDKAGAHWKGPYHDGRALLSCLGRLALRPLS